MGRGMGVAIMPCTRTRNVAYISSAYCAEDVCLHDTSMLTSTSGGGTGAGSRDGVSGGLVEVVALFGVVGGAL
jgi:hypothetical protein